MAIKNHFHIVREDRINTPNSLLTLQPGEEVSISCVEFVQLSTVTSAVTRLNQRAGAEEFSVSSPDNGATIVVKRNVV